MLALLRIAGGGLTMRGDLDALGDTLVGAEEFVRILRLFAVKGAVRRGGLAPARAAILAHVPLQPIPVRLGNESVRILQLARCSSSRYGNLIEPPPKALVKRPPRPP